VVIGSGRSTASRQGLTGGLRSAWEVLRWLQRHFCEPVVTSAVLSEQSSETGSCLGFLLHAEKSARSRCSYDKAKRASEIRDILGLDAEGHLSTFLADACSGFGTRRSGAVCTVNTCWAMALAAIPRLLQPSRSGRVDLGAHFSGGVLCQTMTRRAGDDLSNMLLLEDHVKSLSDDRRPGGPARVVMTGWTSRRRRRRHGIAS